MFVKFAVPFVLGKARPRVVRGHAFTPQRTREAEREIAASYVHACAKFYGAAVIAPKATAVSVRIETSKPLPKSAPKRITFAEDTVKPDSDNIAKLVMDALNGIAWHDDAQVTELFVMKNLRRRDIEEKTEVTISWV